MKTSKWIAAVAAAALIVGIAALVGCTKEQPPTDVSPPSVVNEPVSTEPSGGPTETLEGTMTVKGSDTIVHLATAWAEAMMDKHEGLDISVDGGGSGTGIAALINGTVDIATASRKIKDEEVTEAEGKGITPVEHVVARDGIAVVVNPENPVNEITMEDLAKIFTGQTTNWSAVGGNDQKIGVLSRESSSGTYAFFREHVMDDEDYTTDAKLMPATSAIVEATA